MGVSAIGLGNAVSSGLNTYMGLEQNKRLNNADARAAEANARANANEPRLNDANSRANAGEGRAVEQHGMQKEFYAKLAELFKAYNAGAAPMAGSAERPADGSAGGQIQTIAQPVTQPTTYGPKALPPGLVDAGPAANTATPILTRPQPRAPYATDPLLTGGLGG